MTQFLVLALSHSDQIKQSVEQNIAPADKFDLLVDSAWLVSFQGTAADLSERLGTKDGDRGGVLIAALTDIAGFGPSAMIRWIDDHERQKQ